MIKRIFTLVLVLMGIQMFGQQEEQYTHYMFSTTAYNPGYIGLQEAICLNGVHRQQWIGFQDDEGNSINPVTTFFSVDLMEYAIYGGLGLNFKQDELGAFTNTTVELGYSFHRNIGNGKLGIGIMGGLVDQTIDFGHFKPLDPNDPLLIGSGKEESAMAFDVKFGGYYRVPGHWYAGVSSSKLIESEVALGDDLANPNFSRHYYITGGYTYRLPHPDFVLEPSAMIKTDIAATQYDITSLVWYRDRFYGGLTYRTTDAVSVLVGMKNLLGTGGGNFKQEGDMLGISYDLTTSALGAEGRSAGTVEIFLRYCFNIEIPDIPEGHGTVRFLRPREDAPRPAPEEDEDKDEDKD
ncbi:MAG: PorP/SprF family type IX secretion system membrane protein [Bacteroidales bacterium]